MALEECWSSDRPPSIFFVSLNCLVLNKSSYFFSMDLARTNRASSEFLKRKHTLYSTDHCWSPNAVPLLAGF